MPRVETDKEETDKTEEVAKGVTENGLTLGDTPGQGSATGENGAQDAAVRDAAQIVQGHVIPQDVLDAIEKKVAAFDPIHPTRVYDTADHFREFLIAQYIVQQYPSLPNVSPANVDFDRLVAIAEGKTVGRYIVAHNAVSGHAQGEEFIPGEGVDIARLLDLGAIVEA